MRALRFVQIATPAKDPCPPQQREPAPLISGRFFGGLSLGKGDRGHANAPAAAADIADRPYNRPVVRLRGGRCLGAAEPK